MLMPAAAAATAPLPAHWPTDHPPVPHGKTGVLIINLGTPDATDVASMRRYLKEFLSDRRVIEVNRVLWWLILNGIILNTRPKKSGRAYDKIWDRVNDESPLRGHTRRQAEKLATRLASPGGPVLVDWAMRYGNPSIASRLTALHEAGCERLYLMALYPQYASATTASVYDKAFDALKQMRWQPALRTAPPWHDHSPYIQALADSLTNHLTGLEWQPDQVITSYHGVPKRYLLAGDPYHCHCHKTTRLLLQHLGWSKDRLALTFQSRFGKEEWLKPYTDHTLATLPGQGVRKVVIMTPGFVADCVETLEEIALEARHTFLEAGGTHFSVVPCLNDSNLGMGVIEAVARRDLAGWV